MSETYGQRMFQAGPAEHERRDALAETFDAASHGVLTSLGSLSGWHCLDAGAGRGSIARWLAGQVGETGRVLALDIDSAALEAAPAPGVDVLNGDINDPEVRLTTYDLVYARFLLANMRMREEALRRLAACVRPGGFLVISDAADLGTQHSPSAPFRETHLAFEEMLAETIGSEADFGLRHHALFVRAGLVDVRHEVFWPSITAGSPMSRLLRLSYAQVADRMIEMGKTDRETIDAAIEYLEAPQTSDSGMAMVTTIGRRHTQP